MSDEDLEKLLDRAGRDKVFAYARAAGWSLANPPPKWVWAQMAAEVIHASSLPGATPALQDQTP